MMRLFKFAGLLLLVLVAVAVVTGLMRGGKKSGYANCVVAESPAAFIGERLKFAGNAERMTVKTPECVARDTELDAGDGPTHGRVRWVECAAGPDCDEAGMF